VGGRIPAITGATPATAANDRPEGDRGAAELDGDGDLDDRDAAELDDSDGVAELDEEGG
jgi:hypothetical protein